MNLYFIGCCYTHFDDALYWESLDIKCLLVNTGNSLTTKVDRQGVPIMKHACTFDYNAYMGGVDMSDQIGKYYTVKLRKF